VLLTGAGDGQQKPPTHLTFLLNFTGELQPRR
jgi:hypothetical protein